VFGRCMRMRTDHFTSFCYGGLRKRLRLDKDTASSEFIGDQYLRSVAK